MNIKELRSKFTKQMYTGKLPTHAVTSGWIFSDPPKTDETILAFTTDFDVVVLYWHGEDDWIDYDASHWFRQEDIICWVVIDVPNLGSTEHAK